MMKSNKNFNDIIRSKFEVYEYRHAGTILKHDYPAEYEQIVFFLENFIISYEDILKPGGNKSPIAHKFDEEFYDSGWEEKSWQVSIEVDGRPLPSPTHKVDYYRNRVAIELEWNSKDSVYSRDLNNFKLLHELNVISVGIIITRADELQDLFIQLGKGSSYGASTTHVGKLLPKIANGGSAETPLLVFAINKHACRPELEHLVDSAK